MVKIIDTSHHRNGVSGAPFDVHLFDDDEKGRMVAIDFGGDRFAVLNVSRLAENDIAFGSNSWRGDHYAYNVREAAKHAHPSVAEGAFFVRYALDTTE